MRTTLLRTIALLLGLALIALVLVLFRAATKPISLHFLVPHLERALAPDDSPYEVKLRQVVLDWTRSQRGLDITALGTRVMDRSGSVIISIPSISVEISGRALLRGVIAPKKIELLRPDIYLVVGPGGGIELRVGEEGKEGASLILTRIFDYLLRSHDPAHPSSYVKSIDVWDGNLVIEDSINGVSWHAPDAVLSLKRAEQGIRVSASFGVKAMGPEEGQGEVEGGKGEITRFLVSGFYPRNGDTLNLRASFSQLKPALLAYNQPTLPYLKGIEIPLRGAIGVAIDSTGRIGDAWFHLSGERGELELPSIFSRPISMGNLYVGGRLDNGLSSIRVSEFSARIGEMYVRGNGTIKDAENLVRADGEAIAEHIAVSNLEGYWPQNLLSEFREIIADKLRKGTIDRARASFTIERGDKSSKLPDEDKQKEIRLTHLQGTLEYSGVTASYLSSMPPVRNAQGTASFTNENLEIAITEGEIDGILLKEGRVAVERDNAGKARAHITAHIGGTLREALRAMENPPFRAASLIHLDPEDMSGSIGAEIAADLPMSRNIRSDEINFTTNAEIEGAGTGESWKESAGMELSEGKLRLQISNSDGELRYHMLINSLTVDADPRLNGSVSGSLSLSNEDSTKKWLNITLDLLDTVIKLPELGWRKGPGTPGNATLTMELKGRTPAKIEEFYIKSKGLEIGGTAALRTDEQDTKEINLRRLVAGRTDLNGTIIIKPHGSGTIKDKGRYVYEVLVRGKSLDAKPLLELLKKTKNRGNLHEEEGEKRGSDIARTPPVKIDAKLGLLFIGDEERIENISSVMSHNGRVWESVVTYGEASGSPIMLRVTPKVSDDGRGVIERELAFTSEDAGSTLRALEIYKNMKGGSLKLRADISKDGTEGKLVIRDCLLMDAPVLTKMFTVASFTGLANLITGEGIGFDKIDIRFNKIRNKIDIEDATAWGSNIGIAVERGYVDLENDSMEFEGVLVPAYTLNKFLNMIPLIGKLITGGKGSGILAANYRVRGPIGDPEISVNPLSVLTPGILRDFVNALKEALPEPDEQGSVQEKVITPQ